MSIVKHLEDIIETTTVDKRDYQVEAVNQLITYFDGKKSFLLNYPYGTGKTVIALLVFIGLKNKNPESKFIFTSAREAANLRCNQALEMAKHFEFLDKIGYLFNPKGKGLNLKQKLKMYQAANVIFAPITTLMNDYYEIRSKLKQDIFSSITLCVIDEATDLLARDISGFRISRYFDGLFNIREKKNNFPILAMTGTKDRGRSSAIFNLLGKDALLMQRLDLIPYETKTEITKIKREDYIKIDQAISNHFKKPIEVIQDILDPSLSRLDIIKMSYGGILDKLMNQQGTYPLSINKYQIDTDEKRQELVKAFLLLFKLSHARLLLLESTPGEFLSYIESEENKDLFKTIIDVSQDLISFRVELSDYENPEKMITRALLNPKTYTAVSIIYEHLIKGAQILLFTRYHALGIQMHKLLESLNFPNVSYLSGKTPEDSRMSIIQNFELGETNILIFTPVGGRGINLHSADVVIHLDITTNLDDMIQRRERARGCLEYVLVLEGTSEEEKVKEYQDLNKGVEDQPSNRGE